MRIAVVYPDRRKWPKFLWVAQAIRALGHEVRHVRDAAELRAADRECELIFFEHKSPSVTPINLVSVAKDRKSRWVQWWFDLLATDPGRSLADQELVRAFLPVMQVVDLVFVKERALIGEYQAMGVNARYLDQACPANMPACEHVAEPEWDVLVFGSVRGYRQRVQDVKTLLSAGYSVAWAGHPSGQVPRGVEALPWQPPIHLNDLASRAAVVLCVDARHDVEGYWSDRLWLAMGMGACVVKRSTIGESPARPIYGYDKPFQLVNLLRVLVPDVEARAAIGRTARQFVMANHTYEQRVVELLGQELPEHLQQAVRAVSKSPNCLVCGKPLARNSANQKYCDARCRGRIKRWREQQKLQAAKRRATA